MKRWIRRIVLCLFLGAIINVAVAWGFAMWGKDVTDSPYGVDIKSRDGLFVKEFHSITIGHAPGTLSVWSVRSRDSTIDLRTFEDHGPIQIPDWASCLSQPTGGYGSGGSNREDRYLFAFGWPFVTLWCEVEDVFADEMEVYGGVVVRETPDDVWALPLRPILRGFLANTALYAVGAWALFFFTPSELRRVIRRARGRCPSCGYDLRRDLPAGCPECGWNRPP